VVIAISSACCTVDFLGIENIVVVIIWVYAVVQCIIVMVTAAVFTSIHYTISIGIFPIITIVNSIIVNVQIDYIGNSVVVVIIDIGIWIAVGNFLLVINSITIIVVIFVIIHTIIIVVHWVLIYIVRNSIIIVVVIDIVWNSVSVIIIFTV